MSESLGDTKAEAQARTESTHMSKSVRMIGRSVKERSSNFHELPLADYQNNRDNVTYRLSCLSRLTLTLSCIGAIPETDSYRYPFEA